MFINPYLEDKLAHQRIQEALCVAKLDCLLQTARAQIKNRHHLFPLGILSLPFMIIMAPFRLGMYLARKM
jgi:hypothetical protein